MKSIVGGMIGFLIIFLIGYKMFWRGKSVKSILIEGNEEESLEYLGKSLDLKTWALLAIIVILCIVYKII